MIQPYPLLMLTRETELIPQAIIGAPISHLAKRYHWRLEEGHDDLDNFVGAGFLISSSSSQERSTPFAIMHYKGHPEDTATIYLPFAIQDVATISRSVSRILHDLEITEKIVWERRNEHRTLPA